MPAKVSTSPSARVASTIRLDLTTTDEQTAARQAAELAQAWPGTRVEIIVGDEPLASWFRVLQLLADSAARARLALDVVGTPGATTSWTCELRTLITARVA
ncbi:hypothetical protein ABKW28_11625 [Nocardioides sp. 31GB23]|uniref:hypothetical protein n=1 Tax=Nocardioides sp. 31GB23 TaxID=3156065 RepID=UPI0032AFE823